MSKSRSSLPADTTPAGRLSEASLHLLLGYQLAQASIVTDAVFAEQVGAPFELRPVEYTVLALVHENPDVSATRLAKALAVTAPNIAAWIDRLEKRGLVQRIPHATDRRAQHLLDDVGRQRRRKRSLLQDGRHRRTIDELEREKVRTVDSPELVDRNDVRMGERADHLHLTPHPLPRQLGGRGRRDQQLHGHVGAEPAVARQVHDGVAAAPQLAADFPAVAQHRAGREVAAHRMRPSTSRALARQPSSG